MHLANVSIFYPFEKRSLFEKIKHAVKYRRLPLSLGWCHSSLSDYDIDDKCLIALEPRKSIGILVPEDALEKIFEDCEERLIKASVQDELWRNKYSREFEYPKTNKSKA